MPNRKSSIALLIMGLTILTVAVFSLLTATPVKAQCGSQASSCKNCHEVQAKMPVNSDGTDWHSAHAFGDFCHICHAGNSQSLDEAEAHTGMVAPLADINAACLQCHPNDLEELAQVYATTLGVEIGVGAPPAASTNTNPAGSSVPSGTELAVSGGELASVSAPPASELVVDDANLVDYTLRYEEIVLGKKPVNTGNMILIALIALVGFGGGGFVLYTEIIKRFGQKKVQVLDVEYPQDVTDLLPAISQLKKDSRNRLKNILENPQKTESILKLVDPLVSDETFNEARP
jgi:hypothetical protein